MRRAIPFVAVLSLALAGCASDDLGTMLGLRHTDAPILAAPYMAQAMAAEQFQIQAAQLAVTKAQRPQVRAFAQRILGDHTRAAGQIVRAAEHEGLMPPAPQMTGAQAQMLADLQAAAPDVFDDLFLDQQIATDKDSYWLHRRYALVGDEPKLRTIAANGSFFAHDHFDRARKLD